MRRSQRGFSLIEMLIVLAIISVIMIIVFSLIEETVHTTMFNESHNDLAIMSQRGMNTLQAELLQTRVAFEEDATGAEYRSALAFPAGSPAVWSDSFLPIIDTAGEIEPDAAGTRLTGNALLIARQLPPLSIMYDHDDDITTDDVEFLADRYRFEYVYLSPNPKRFALDYQTLDLMMSTSGEYADFFQLSAMGSATSELARKLITPDSPDVVPILRAWDPGQSLNNAFYDLGGALDDTFNAPVNRPTIPILTTKSLFRELLGGRISGKMDYSVAYLAPPPLRPIPLPALTPLSVYAEPDPAEPGFPSGFEVKIVGPARNRKVMTRVVLMSNYRANYFESQQGFVVTAARF